MDKVDIKIGAAIAEIIASLAVVVSLLFVVYSISQNTTALQASNDNFLYERHLQLLNDSSMNGEIASIIVRFDADEELTEVDEFRYRQR